MQEVRFPSRNKPKAIASVMPMIYKKAHRTKNMLAPATRNWVDIKDLAHDGVVHVLENVIPTFKPKKRLFSSHAFQLLDHHFQNRVLVSHSDKKYNGTLRASERDARKTISYDVPVKSPRTIKQDEERSFLDILADQLPTNSHQDRIITKIDAERAFLPLYKTASPLLRKYLIRWLLQPQITKFKKGENYKAVRKEFRQLCKIYGFRRELGELIIMDDRFRRELCFRIVCVLRIRTKRKVTKPDSLLNSRELALVPLFCRTGQA